MMKKHYIRPVTESVKVNLYGSILESIGTDTNSYVSDVGLAKENDILWGDDSTSGDLWEDVEDEEY